MIIFFEIDLKRHTFSVDLFALIDVEHLKREPVQIDYKNESASLKMNTVIELEHATTFSWDTKQFPTKPNNFKQNTTINAVTVFFEHEAGKL